MLLETECINFSQQTRFFTDTSIYAFYLVITLLSPTIRIFS